MPAMGMWYYILRDDHSVVATDDPEEWARAFERTDRTVAVTRVGQYEVSTFFIGVNMRYFWDGPARVFETIVFDAQRQPDGRRRLADIEDGHDRYATWDEAAAGHGAIVGRLKGQT